MKKTLQELAAISSGLHFRGRVEAAPDGNAALVQIKDVDEEFGLCAAGLERVHLEKIEPYRVRQGDVLFIARGTRLGAVEVREPLENAIATGSFFVLRPRTAVLPAYLTWAINAPHFQAHLRRAEQGTGLLLVRRADLEDMTIEVPPLHTQHAIVTLDACAQRERHLLAQLSEKRTLLATTVASRAAAKSSMN